MSISRIALGSVIGVLVFLAAFAWNACTEPQEAEPAPVVVGLSDSPTSDWDGTTICVTNDGGGIYVVDEYGSNTYIAF